MEFFASGIHCFCLYPLRYPVPIVSSYPVCSAVNGNGEVEMSFNRSCETSLPFDVMLDEMVPIYSLNARITEHHDRLILLAVQGDKSRRHVRLARMSSAVDTQFLACEHSEIRIRGYYALGNCVFLTGSARLRELLEDTATLDALVGVLHQQKDQDTGLISHQARFVGELECCLFRFGGKWIDCTANGSGPAVVGINVPEGIVYAISLRSGEKSLEIVMAKKVCDGQLVWNRLTLAPNIQGILDAGRFVYDSDGSVVSLVALSSGEYRLLTIDAEGKIYWSESTSLPGEAIDRDTDGSVQHIERTLSAKTILTQRWAVDGFLVSRYPVNDFAGLVLWAYLRASS